MQVICAKCGGQVKVGVGALGSEVPCPACGDAVAVPSAGFAPGTEIGGFRIERLLGRGGMGEVYLARQLSMDRNVALKILLPGHVAREKTVPRFLKEIRMQARLDHPHIVTAYEAGEDGGVIYLAMAYVQGSTVLSHIKARGKFNERQALSILLKIADALAYAWNEHRLLHRDIKPANILLDRNGEPKLADMGLSKVFDDEEGLTLSGTTVGTPNYMSPEQVMGRKDLDFRSDMYALGTTFYHMLTACMPFEGSSVVSTLRRQATEKLPDPRRFNKGVSDACVGLLEVMLAKDAGGRYESWEALIAVIRDILAGHLTGNSPMLPGESMLLRDTAGVAETVAERSVRSRVALRLGIAAAGLLCLVAAFGAGRHFLSSNRKPPAVVSNPPTVAPNPPAAAPATPTAAPTPPAVAASTKTVFPETPRRISKAEIPRLILAEQFDDAIRLLEEALKDPPSSEAAERVGMMLESLKKVSQMPVRILASFEGDKGRTVAVETKSGKVEGILRSVDLSGRCLTIEPPGRSSETVKYEDLSAAEKGGRLGPGNGAAVGVMRGIIQYASGDTRMARRLFVESGDFLGRELARYLDMENSGMRPPMDGENSRSPRNFPGADSRGR